MGTKQDTMKSTIKPMSLNSSRIINLEELREHSWYLSSCSNMPVMHWQGIHTRWSNYEEQFRDGLVSVLTAQCKGCGTKSAFPKSSKVNCKGARQSRKCNLAAVWGQMATGGGCSPLQESISILGVRSCYDQENLSWQQGGLLESVGGRCWMLVWRVLVKRNGT